MSQRVKIDTPRKIIGKRNGPEPESSVHHDVRLEVGVSYNDAPPLRSAGDVEASLVRVRCQCSAAVAVLWSVDRRARELPRFYYLNALIIDDPDMPASTRIASAVVAPDRHLVADCAVHGRQSIDSAALLARAHGAEARIARGRQQMVSFILPGKARTDMSPSGE